MTTDPSVEMLLTFGGLSGLVFVLMGAFGKPIIRRALKLPAGEDIPEGSGYSIWVNGVAVILGILFAVGGRYVVDGVLTGVSAVNAGLLGLFAGLSGTGLSEVWGNAVARIRR